MLHELTSDLPDFKNATFRPGLNIVLAERTRKATSQDSRNAVGKTSLIKVLDFLLGSDARPNHVVRRLELAPSTFTLSFDIDGEMDRVSRSGSNTGTVFLDEEYMKIRDWRTYLGRALFSLQGLPGEPAYRQAISFYLRDVLYDWWHNMPDGPGRIRAMRWFGEWTGARDPYHGGDQGAMTPGFGSQDADQAYDRYIGFLDAVFHPGRLGPPPRALEAPDETEDEK